MNDFDDDDWDMNDIDPDDDDDGYYYMDIYMYSTDGSPGWINWSGRNRRLYLIQSLIR